MANKDSTGSSAADQAETKKCPNCGKGSVSKDVPDNQPWFGPPNRCPQDNETILNSSSFSSIGKRALGKGANASVFQQQSTGNLFYRDKFHKGKGAELEVFKKEGQHHLGAMCVLCGHLDTSKRDNKRVLKLS